MIIYKTVNPVKVKAAIGLVNNKIFVLNKKKAAYLHFWLTHESFEECLNLFVKYYEMSKRCNQPVYNHSVWLISDFEYKFTFSVNCYLNFLSLWHIVIMNWQLSKWETGWHCFLKNALFIFLPKLVFIA